MRTALLKKGNIAAIVALAALLLALRSALPCAAFASDDSSSLTERHVWFTYGYTECTGDVHPVSDSGVESGESDGTAYPKYYSTYMMACDTDHKLRLAGDVAADDNVTFSSSNPSVLEIDDEGNVTLMKTGTARVTATVAANEVYDECTIYLDIKIDRHTGRIETVRPHYTDRPEAWGLDLDTSDGPHQLTMLLRPGARVKYSSENQNVAYVSGKGVVTPVSAGTTQIFFDIDDAEGRYKACRFGLTINITGEAIPDDLLPKDRDVWFTYECTDCLGKSCSVEREQMGYDVSSPYFGVDMMLCDTAHKIHVEGEDVTADNVTLTALDPDVLTVDSAGNVMLLKAGRGRIKATVAEDNKYKESSIYLAVTVDRHDGWIGTSPVYFEGSPFGGLQLDTADGPQKLVVPLRPGAGVSCSIDDPNVAIVDPDGTVTPVSAGTAQIRFDVDDGGGRYKAGFFTETIRVTGEDLRSSQEIKGDQGPFIIDVHDGLKLSLQAKTSLEYSICSGMGIASVDQSGMVSFTQAGTVSVRVRAVQSRDYKPAEIIIKITARDYAAEEAARIAEEEAAQKAAEEAAARKTAEEEAAQKAAAEEAEAKRAAEETAAQKAPVASAQKTSVKKKSSKVVLKRPAFKVRALKGRKIKLTWSKVAGADGYVVYVKYPGSKKYVKAVTKNATVKSVTHRGLSKDRVYRYKVRAYKKVKGKRIYSPFSKGRKARVR